jgi:hypothetical protein
MRRRFKAWLAGIGMASIPLVYGMHCLITGHTRLLGRNHGCLDYGGRNFPVQKNFQTRILTTTLQTVVTPEDSIPGAWPSSGKKTANSPAVKLIDVVRSGVA